ncbi:hypothetical protein [Hyphococcus luteus]|uniref:Uncharacterized protein n=1 Tax=Hyphococcus luteus TaxID=2058213 RepID=A0A2S7KAM3_9PROT|nr:hypothetical protein [Marinicaulis flavus]PQA89566.1 hypothetical protein CW354_01470 [Marinicaulis flavus]
MQPVTENAQTLLESIYAFCRQHSMAESTFGRRAVNDGKFVSRLKDGSRLRPETWDRVVKFISSHGGAAPSAPDPGLLHILPSESLAAAASDTSSEKNFRFFDNRQKYLMFVNTCSEKDIVAERAGMELSHIHPAPPAIRLFDGGIGDGTVLAKLLREMHGRFPTMPFYVSGKEISLEDIRLTLGKMADRLFEHPATVLVFTNMFYSEAPWLTPKKQEAKDALVWKEVALKGGTAHDFDRQISELDSFLTENWQARHSPKTGNPIYDHPAVLVIYREDYKFLLNDVIPKQGEAKADYDLVLASQPYRLRVPAAFKAKNVIAPLARALRPSGRLLGIHSYGRDPGMEIINRIWPDDNPFETSRHDILRALKDALGDEAEEFDFNAFSDDRSIFQYKMHTLPTEVDSSIGTSTLFAAWNDAVYVAQIEDDRLEDGPEGADYLQATREVLKKHGGLWFNDESYVVSRTRGA